MKGYLTSLSPFLLSFYIYVSLFFLVSCFTNCWFFFLFFFWCHVSPIIYFLSPFLQNARLVILYLHNPSSYARNKASHFSFFLSFFLGTSLNRFLFFDFSCCQSTNQIVTCFLSFSDGILIFPYELAWERQLALRATDTTVSYGIS